MQTLSTHTPSAVTLTQSAISFIKRMLRLSGAGPTGGLRLVVSPGGCSGLQSTFTVETAPKGDEEILSFGDVRLFVPAQCRPLLEGVTVDFTDTPTHTGFAFSDSKASDCGCSSTPVPLTGKAS